MNSDNQRSAIMPQQVDEGIDKKLAESAERPAGRRSPSASQLKHYPQSLQTAARALWG